MTEFILLVLTVIMEKWFKIHQCKNDETPSHWETWVCSEERFGGSNQRQNRCSVRNRVMRRRELQRRLGTRMQGEGSSLGTERKAASEQGQQQQTSLYLWLCVYRLRSPLGCISRRLINFWFTEILCTCKLTVT